MWKFASGSSMKCLYWKWDKKIPKEYCDLIIKEVNWDKTEKAEVGFKEKKLDKKTRKTDIFWQSQYSIVGCIADRYIRSANISAEWRYDLTATEDIQIGKYYDGGFYKWHKDASNLVENPRKLSFVLLLNDPKEFVGGVFEFKDLKEQPVMEQGSILVFPSFLEHRVTPVTDGVRYSAVTWMQGPYFR